MTIPEDERMFFTADDFAVARFAEHGDGRIAARFQPDSQFCWATTTPDRGHSIGWMTDQHLADAVGWRPVTTRTLHSTRK